VVIILVVVVVVEGVLGGILVSEVSKFWLIDVINHV
jgi:hypothetical protein